MFSRSERARKIKQLSLCSWRWMGKGGAVEWELYQDHCAVTSKLANFGPSSTKTAFSASHLGTTFNVVSEIRSIFIRFFCTIQARHPKNAKMTMGAAQENKFRPFLVWCRSWGWKYQHLQFWGIFAPTKNASVATRAHFDPESWLGPPKPKNRFPEHYFWKVGERGRRLFRAPAAITGARLSPRKHCKDRVLWHWTLCAPCLNACPGAFSNEWKGKSTPLSKEKTPHYRT